MALQLENEAFHSWLLLAVIPTSVFSLLVGCKQHKYYQLLVIGFFGLLFLISAIFIEGLLEHGKYDGYADLLEKVFTLIGACILALGHYLNFRLCNNHDDCGCQNGEWNGLTF